MLKRSLGMLLPASVPAHKRLLDCKGQAENERDLPKKPHAQASLEHATGFFPFQAVNLLPVSCPSFINPKTFTRVASDGSGGLMTESMPRYIQGNGG